MGDWLTQYYRNISEAEELEEALAEMWASTGHWRAACRRDAMKMVLRMKRERDAGRASLHAAAERARERRAA